ncbi:MAG: HD domain-containing protein [Planctomycetota bacterium]|nr:MAG: HD domain-containing protein [Planctomycetota bacterium]
MSNDKLRRQILAEAARMMYERQETEYYRAKIKAARKFTRRWLKPSDLPSNREIRMELQRLTLLHEGDSHAERLREMRFRAYQVMRLLEPFRPRLIGSTLTGHVRKGSDIDIHVFADNPSTVATVLEAEGLHPRLERKRVRKDGQQRQYTHIHFHHHFPFELTVYPANKAHYVFKSSITGRPMERASLRELRELLKREYPDHDPDAEQPQLADEPDRFDVYRSLLIPLQTVRERRDFHPESDALYHSLQVFDLARQEAPYDEELLAAALLHDVGKAIDPLNHVEAGLHALEGTITERTAWLIEHHMEAHDLLDGTLGMRARRRLSEHPDYDALVILAQCDRAGRVPGASVPELEEALDYLRELESYNG